MLISGIWHGAGYNFILWGFLHALFIFFEKVINIKIFDGKFKFIKIVYCYFVITVLWLFFRVDNINDIQIFFLNFSFTNILDLSTIYFISSIFIFNFLQKYITVESLINFYKKLNKIFIISMSFILIATCIILSKGSSQKFIYFNPLISIQKMMY